MRWGDKRERVVRKWERGLLTLTSSLQLSPSPLPPTSYCLLEAYRINFNGLSNNAFLPHSGFDEALCVCVCVSL